MATCLITTQLVPSPRGKGVSPYGGQTILPVTCEAEPVCDHKTGWGAGGVKSALCTCAFLVYVCPSCNSSYKARYVYSLMGAIQISSLLLLRRCVCHDEIGQRWTNDLLSHVFASFHQSSITNFVTKDSGLTTFHITHHIMVHSSLVCVGFVSRCCLPKTSSDLRSPNFECRR